MDPNMTIFEYQAQGINRAATMLAFTLGTTALDKVTWCPCAQGEASDCRSALQQADECVRVNNSMAALLRGEEPGEHTEVASVEQAKAELTASGENLANAVRGMAPADLGKMYPTRMGEWPGSMIMSVPAFNMMYHVGQINYIQTLYGDTEFRVPPME
jgi:hypothetical protein